MKNRALLLSFYFIFMSGISACASTSVRVENDLKEIDQHIEKLNQQFSTRPENLDDIEWIKAKLDHMFEIDQFARRQWHLPLENNYSREETNQFNLRFLKRNNQIDRMNTADVKALLKKYEWFKISVFGKIADNKGWLLVQHADLDINFQKDILLILEKLYPLKETEPSNYAFLFDRVASSSNDPSKRKLQRYGTQGRCTGPGKWEPDPIDDVANVDKRRKSMGLSTMDEYKAVFKDICK